MLKSDLHLHSKEDKIDSYIKYTSRELIDKAAKLGFDVLSFTFHDQYYYPRELVEYAKEKGILLIQGVEKNIEGKHVLLYNISKEDLDRIKTLEDLKKLNKKTLVIAPHPYYHTRHCLGRRLKRYIEFIYALEYYPIYNTLINWNKKALKIAKRYNKTIVANSDSHKMKQFGRNFSLIDAERDVDSVIEAIKKNRIRFSSQKMSLFQMVVFCLEFLFSNLKRKF
jgi:predicted metal-dependent phosphoesterase TrpH